MKNLPTDMSKIWEALQPSQIPLPLFQFPTADIDHLLPWETAITEPIPEPPSSSTETTYTIEDAVLVSTFDLPSKLDSILEKMADIHQDIESEDHRFNPEDYDSILCLIGQINTLITNLENKIK